MNSNHLCSQKSHFIKMWHQLELVSERAVVHSLQSCLEKPIAEPIIRELEGCNATLYTEFEFKAGRFGKVEGLL